MHARTHARTNARGNEKKTAKPISEWERLAWRLQVTPEFGPGQMRPHARAGSEMAPRGCFLWYKETHHKAPVHVRTTHARSWPAPPKPGICEVCVETKIVLKYFFPLGKSAKWTFFAIRDGTDGTGGRTRWERDLCRKHARHKHLHGDGAARNLWQGEISEI